MISTAFWYDQILFPFPWDTLLDFYHNHLLFVSSHISKLMIHLLWQLYTPMTQHCPHPVWQIMQYPLCHVAFLTFATFCSVTSGLHLFIKPLYLHLWKHLLTVDFGDMPFSEGVTDLVRYCEGFFLGVAKLDSVFILFKKAPDHWCGRSWYSFHHKRTKQQVSHGY